VGLRVLLTFLVPLAFAATVPAQAIAGLATGRTLLAAVAFTAALTTLTRWAWKQGLRHYSGSMSSGNAVKGRPGPAGDPQPWPNPTSRPRPANHARAAICSAIGTCKVATRGLAELEVGDAEACQPE
jgi:hypothetical protein